MKLFIEDLKGYMETINRVLNVKITKKDNNNILVVYTKENNLMPLVIPLSKVRLCYLVEIVKDINGDEYYKEYFRYEK